MKNNGLNLMGLSEEELQHISEVLSRDKKLQERSNFVKVTVNNNNYESDNQKHVTVNDLVSAEIGRVKRLTPASGQSGRSTPLRATSDAGSVTPTDEGLFKSFTGMLTRTLHAIDFSNRNREDMPTVKALAGATVELNSIPKVPFNYNHRETMKKKPTLLELSAFNSHSLDQSTSPITSTRLNSAIMQYRRSRGNARFFSSPDNGFSTIPRNYRHSGPSSIAIPVTLRSRSPSLEPQLNSGSPNFQNYQINSRNRRSQFSSPKSSRPASSDLPTQPANAVLNKYPRRSSSFDDEPLRFFPSPDARESPDGEYTQIPVETNIVRACAEIELRKTKQDMFETAGLSCDSGVCSKSEDLIKDLDSDSLLGDDVSLNRLVIAHGYESDVPSVSDFDLYTPWNTHDNISLASAASLRLDSPVRRAVSHEGSQCHVNRCETNRSYTHRISPAGVLSEPKCNTLNGKGIHKGHLRNISTGSASTFAMSAPGSPAVSRKSLTLPSRSHTERDSLSLSKCEDPNTVGNLEVSVVYYSSDDLKRKKMKKVEIPRNGTKSGVVHNCNVLSRKEYAEVTDSNLTLNHSYRSGCPESIYGELHVTIKGAKFQDPAGKIKAPTTYVKCYLLPDKFHNSKMKTAVVKKNNEPSWDHTFVLAGFSQSELRERSLEVIVGSWHFKKQEVIGGAILSIGQGGPHRPWIKSSKAEAYVWKTALQISGSKVKAFVPLRANMKPTYL